MFDLLMFVSVVEIGCDDCHHDESSQRGQEIYTQKIERLIINPNLVRWNWQGYRGYIGVYELKKDNGTVESNFLSVHKALSCKCERREENLASTRDTFWFQVLSKTSGRIKCITQLDHFASQGAYWTSSKYQLVFHSGPGSKTASLDQSWIDFPDIEVSHQWTGNVWHSFARVSHLLRGPIWKWTTNRECQCWPIFPAIARHLAHDYTSSTQNRYRFPNAT